MKDTLTLSDKMKLALLEADAMSDLKSPRACTKRSRYAQIMKGKTWDEVMA